jgi:hypothetical protein
VGVIERMTINPLEVTTGVNEVLKYKIKHYRLTFFIPSLISDHLSSRIHQSQYAKCFNVCTLGGRLYEAFDVLLTVYHYVLQ